MKSKIIFCIILLWFLTTLIFSVISLGGNNPVSELMAFDKQQYILHFISYSLGATLVLIFVSSKELLWLSVIVIWSFVTEFVQLFVPSRSFNVLDITANLAGIGFVYVMYLIFFKRRLKSV